MRLTALDHDLVYVDLADPPDWFLEISPLKKVPLLYLGEDVLFESAVINEYLDEISGCSLHPADPLEKAKHRAWIEFSNHVTWHAYHLTVEKTEADFERALGKMWKDLDEVEKALPETPFFGGASLCLVDISFASFFQQLEHLAGLFPGIANKQRHPRVYRWWKTLCAYPEVESALGDDFADSYHALIYRRRGYLSRFVNASRYAGQGPSRY